MDISKMTLLTWHDGSEPAPEGTIALVLIQDYEYYNFSDYEKFRIVEHFSRKKVTGFGVSEGNSLEKFQVRGQKIAGSR